METPLTTADGFPRADIDVYAVRHARVRIIELRNDMTKLMDDIGKALEGVYGASNAASSTPLVNGTGPSPGSASANADLRVFARVDGVFSGSPASDAVRLFVHTISNSSDNRRFLGSSAGRPHRPIRHACR